MGRPLFLYSTHHRRKELFVPLDPAQITLYVCGPTVYDSLHVGNARPLLVFDVLYRLLRYMYPLSTIQYVRNITDVDDKIIARAGELGEDIAAFTAQQIINFRAICNSLSLLPPTMEPLATAYIHAMQDMIIQLLDSGHAYVVDDHVLFDTVSYADYGQLSHRLLDEQISGIRIAVGSYKKHPADFILWKPSAVDVIGWDSPWGYGRPGWHMECSAMIKQCLGSSIDIHGGGIDLLFPHHENEVAQSVCANHAPLARYWMHNGHVMIDGEKMSKSLGNFTTVADVLDSHSPMAVRLALLNAHYRQPLDFSIARLAEMTSVLHRLPRVDMSLPLVHANVSPAFLDALCDDLNIPLALSHFYETAKALHHDPSNPALASCVRNEASLLGIELALSADAALPSVVVDLCQRRDMARKQKDYVLSDALRNDLEVLGYTVMDSPSGTIVRR